MKKNLNFSILNIDKPSGPTSFQISDYVRKSLGLSKTSHMGTLDPKVTGVLPITLGRACRLSQWLMGHDKKYVGIMRLHESITKKDLEEKMKPFIGKITQLPPKKSSVKRAEREREIKSFKILEKSGKDVLFETEVQAGTYIRKLIHDLGETLEGAHMLELRRTKAGYFSEDQSNLINLYNLDKAVEEYKSGDLKKLEDYLVPAEEVIRNVLPVVQINPNSLKQILTGKPLFKEDIVGDIPEEETFALFHKEQFISINKKYIEGDIIAKPEFVFN